LQDGKWHDIKEIIEKFELHEFKAELLIDFFKKFNFIEVDKNQHKIRLTKSVVEFLEKV